MSQINIQRLREQDQESPFSQDTVDLVNRVQTRAFELFKNRGGLPGNDLVDWLQAEREVFRVPDLELVENEREFQLQLALPGYDSKDVRVAALPDALIVEGEAAHQHRSTEGIIRLCEFGERRVFRQIPLPKPVDVNHVSAILERGMLQIRATKALQDKGKKAAA